MEREGLPTILSATYVSPSREGQNWGRLLMATAFRITSRQKSELGRIGHLMAGQYASLDIEATIEYFRRYFVEPVSTVATVTQDTVVADIGAGYGWLAIAWALNTPARVVAVDLDAERLMAGRQIAGILGVGDRITWRPGALGSLPLADGSVDIACCVEVLEHVYGNEQAVVDLGRVSRNLVLLTTPNKWFPKIAHDTQLPFCHWLPVPLRRLYAAAAGRTKTEIDNLFWSGPRIARLLPGYRRVPGFMHFRDVGSFLGLPPYYLPYGKGRWVDRIGTAKRVYFAVAARLGGASHFVLPNLAGIYRRVTP